MKWCHNISFPLQECDDSHVVTRVSIMYLDIFVVGLEMVSKHIISLTRVLWLSCRGSCVDNIPCRIRRTTSHCKHMSATLHYTTLQTHDCNITLHHTTNTKLQHHTSSHCNTRLQRHTTHCNTRLQYHTTSHCNTRLQHHTTHCKRTTATSHYITLQHTNVHE